MFRLIIVFMASSIAPICWAERFVVEQNTIFYLEAMDTEGEILNDEDVEKIQINKSLPGKKISSVEILVKIENE